MDLALILLIVLVVLAAGVAQTVAGFGFALIAVPPLIAVLEPREVVVMVSILGLSTAALVLRQTWPFVPWPTVAVLLAASTLAMPAGLAVLLLAPSDALRIGVGCASVVMAIALASGLRFGASGPAAQAIAGATAGILSTSTGMNGPPVVLYLADQRVPPSEFRGALSAFFLASGVISLSLFAFSGVVTASALLYAAIALPLVFAGNWIGHRLVGRVDAGVFRSLVLGLLIVTALVAITTTVARISM